MVDERDPPSVLIVDDDPIVLGSLGALLTKHGFVVHRVESLSDAVESLERCNVSVLITDVHLAGGDGFELAEAAKRHWPHIPVIMITGFGTIPRAVEAVNSGVIDYLMKPVQDDRLLSAIERAIQKCSMRGARHVKMNPRPGHWPLIARSNAMKEVEQLARRAAGINAPVVIFGKSGSGRSTLARIIHENSRRSGQPYVEVECARQREHILESDLLGHVRGAFSGSVREKQGKIRAADCGTLRLSNIDHLPEGLTPMVLKLLQSRQVEPIGSDVQVDVDVRIIATMAGAIDANRLSPTHRELIDLLSGVRISMPSLSDRLDDLPLLIREFCDEAAVQNGFSTPAIHADALAVLSKTRWPGQAGQLRSVCTRAVIAAAGDEIALKHLSDDLRTADATTKPLVQKSLTLKEALSGPEQRIIEDALRTNQWNRQDTARQLGIDRTTLYKKMRRYKLIGPDDV